LYVTSEDSIFVIAGSTNAVIDTIPIGSFVDGIVYDSANGNLYVHGGLPSGGNGVYVISGQTNTVIGNPIPVGNGAGGIAFDSANGNLYVANMNDDTVSVISGVTNKVVESPIILDADMPFSIAFDPINNNIYVTDSDPSSSTVSVIATTPTHPPRHIQQLLQLLMVTVLLYKVAVLHFLRLFTAGTNPISAFQCSLDNSLFSSCSSPATFNNLAAGPHEFSVVAVDSAGIKDPNPATFSWTIINPPPTPPSTTITS
jgi:YVTN family beta-propeller protein